LCRNQRNGKGLPVRARSTHADERQADLFGMPPAPPLAARMPARSRNPPAEPPAAEPETATAFAARATEADLDELVAALDDDALAQLALASARQLKRRLTRAYGRQPRSGRKRASALDKAGAQLAAEWAKGVEEDAW
jgi:hypothetical protein